MGRSRGDGRQDCPGGGAHRPYISPISRPYLAHISPISRKVEALIATATDLESLQRCVHVSGFGFGFGFRVQVKG